MHRVPKSIIYYCFNIFQFHRQNDSDLCIVFINQCRQLKSAVYIKLSVDIFGMVVYGMNGNEQHFCNIGISVACCNQIDDFKLSF